MNLPHDFCERMKSMLKDEYDAFINAFSEGEPYTAIRINSAKPNAAAAMAFVTDTAERVPWCADGYYCSKSSISGNHPYHAGGLFYFQEPSAMAVVEAADIQKGDFVLDLCAAPGGKSTHVLSKLGGSGLLVANEISKKRAAILAENVERFGAANTLVTNEAPNEIAQYFGAFFDKVIVDSPCSGEGMFRKEPQAVDEWSEAHTRSCAARSQLIVDCAVKLLKPNGRLVYSTCTFAPCENEGVVEYILNTYDDMKLVSIPQLDMLDCGKGEYIGSKRDFSFTRRVFPHHHKGEGHFIAVFEKADGSIKPKAVQPQKKQPSKADMAAYREFEKKFMNITLDGTFVLFGDNLYRLPNGIAGVDGLKVVRAGLHLGMMKKGRFEPSHALALAFDKTAFANSCELSGGALNAYLHGEAVEGDGSGWVCVCADGFPIGWGKASGGMIKNHFPKHLRIR